MRERARHDRTTIYDVARLAGVSHQTVSRVINNELGVAARTRQRVLDSIQQLGYRRRSAARSLASSTSQTLAVLSTGGCSYGPSATVLGIHRAAARHRLAVLSSLLERHTASAVPGALGLLLAEEPMALIAVTDDEQAAGTIARICEQSRTPYVLTGATPPNNELAPHASVRLDQETAGQEAVEQLLARGARRIGYIPGPRFSADAQSRQVGVLRAATQHGIPLRRLPEGDWTVKAGFRIADSLRSDEVDGIVAANDRMAIGAIQALQARGVSVPGEVQVIGFDDGPEAALVDPSLSSMRLSFDLLGVMAVRAALDLTRGTASDVAIRSQFVERGSVRTTRTSLARIGDRRPAAV
ncbi:LacI family DNA-binding transcriptional regulator [Curtobacterium albidum]|uniref:LacI family DNA-binding transcriptional regulator n=1 Tax=Curtobacterium citreum TaxID=2036 RepID=A0A850E0N4_9MICO|nr:LacI family DNA-binding transcriptional regulator [Curtobacterium albidum]NUU29203.1 LacI family DNA-binding transcriptional regulator [Curtobacterium albidum]